MPLVKHVMSLTKSYMYDVQLYVRLQDTHTELADLISVNRFWL